MHANFFDLFAAFSVKNQHNTFNFALFAQQLTGIPCAKRGGKELRC